MNRSTATRTLLLTLAALSILVPTTSADTATMAFQRIDAPVPLDGAVNFVSKGPMTEAVGESGLEGRRQLRVSLSRVEGSERLMVESLFVNRAGGASVEWAAELWNHELLQRFPFAPGFTRKGFRWIDHETFEFTQSRSRLDPPTRSAAHERINLRYTLENPGVFEVKHSVVPATVYMYANEAAPSGHAERRYDSGDTAVRFELAGASHFPFRCTAADGAAALAVMGGPNPYSSPCLLFVALDDCSVRFEVLDGIGNPVAAHTFDEIAAGPYQLFLRGADLPKDSCRVRIWEGDHYVGEQPYIVLSGRR